MEFQGEQTIHDISSDKYLTARTCGGEVTMEPRAEGDDPSYSVWLMYSIDATLNGDYRLINKALADCASEDNMLVWDGCGFTSLHLGTQGGDSVWRVRPRPDLMFKYENISRATSKNKKCLGVSNYLNKDGTVASDYFGSDDFSGKFQPALYKPLLQTQLWMYDGEKRHYLGERACDSSNYKYYEEEYGLATTYNIIPSVADPNIFHIQSVHSLYNCPNSFLHY